MTISTVLLILVSAFGWSLFDISRKKTGTLLRAPVALQLYMILSLPIFFAWALWEGDLSIQKSYWLLALFGVLVNFFANWSFIESVTRSPLSLSVPMLAFVPVFSTIFSYIFLGEVLVFKQIIGVLVVVAGSFMLNGRPKFSGDQSGPWLMFVAAVLWSLMLVIDKICLRSVTVPMHVTLQTLGIIFCTAFLIRKRKMNLNFFDSMKRGGFYLWLGVVGVVIGAGMQLVVMPLADIGIIEAVKRSGNMSISLVWGFLIFGERISLQKFAALAVLLLGTFIVLQVI
jgi:drug/metabolite transporter (DMT)-like permease